MTTINKVVDKLAIYEWWINEVVELLLLTHTYQFKSDWSYYSFLH